MEIDLFDETGTLTQEDQDLVLSILDFAGNHLQLPVDTELSVTFVNNERIQEINREYRQKDMPTDVISFALNDESETDLPLNMESLGADFPFNLGDIIISTEKAAEQAESYGHSYQRELGFLALHGFLHLNGYDHMTTDEEKEMFGLQKEILDDYGLKRDE